jgi:hypothetical protein
MKALQRIYLPVMMLGGLLLSSSFKTTRNASTDPTPGIYATYDDYVKHHVTPYDAIALGHSGFKGTVNGKKAPVKEYKNADAWGAQDENGVIYRFNKKANVADRVISNGKVCFYAGMELVVQRFDDGTVKSMTINADNGQKFSELFWVSQGGEGDMVGASIDNLSSLFADSPALIEKMKAKGIDEKNTKNWVDNFTNVAGWVGEYDKAHQ